MIVICFVKFDVDVSSSICTVLNQTSLVLESVCPLLTI